MEKKGGIDLPIIFLSPSTQEYNAYVNDLGTEEEWMNHLADAMEPILFASGIQYTRNDRDQTAAAAIRASNAGNYDLHLALHSNASGEGQAGQNQGIIAFYFLAAPGDAGGPVLGQWAEGHLPPTQPGAHGAHHHHRGGPPGARPCGAAGAGLPRQ